MNNKTGPAAENRVKLILAIDRIADVATGLVALESVAVIPAPRPLANLPGQRAHIPDLRRRDAFGRLRQPRILPPDHLMPTQRIERNQSADVHAATGLGHLIEPADRLQIDQHIRVDDPLFYHAE